MIASSVKEAVTSIFAGLQPVLASMALDPKKLGEALREANRPIENPADIAARLREERESLKSKEDEAELRRQTQARQDACKHQDRNGKSAICLVHNALDHQPRGVCPLCAAWIHPREWRIAATFEEAAKHKVSKGKAYICDEHKDFHVVAALESFS
jgi:hypothetical protein